MSNPFQLKFTLKQHTPLIHFQHDQAGATLRATEVKPKLDKFILTEYGDNNYNIGIEKAIENGWIKGQHNSLNYKIRIEVSPGSKSICNSILTEADAGWNSKKYPLLLANMGKKDVPKDELKDLLGFENNVVIITCLNKELLAKIEKSIILFFATNNFGNRQGKGFGSFTVLDLGDRKGNKVVANFPRIPNTHYIELDTIEIESIFAAIDYYWKCLKSGINYSNRWGDPIKYKKSVLFNYLNSLTPPRTWEKRWIKEKYYGLPGRPGLPQATFARAYLGLPDKFEFAMLPSKGGDRKEKYYELEGDYTNKEKWAINISHPDIDRIKSPITFKPVIGTDKTTVYLFINSIDLSAYAATDFLFTSMAKKIKYSQNGVKKELLIEFTFKENENLDEKKLDYIQKIRDLKDMNSITTVDYDDAMKYINMEKKHSLKLGGELNIEEVIAYYHRNNPNGQKAIDFRGNTICNIKSGKLN